MPEHFTPELIENYRARTLAPDELVAAAGHLADCAECRAEVAPASGQSKLLEALSGLQAPDEHLQYEALEALAKGGRTGLNHIADCIQCAEELRDLRSFRENLKQQSAPSRGIRFLVPLTAVTVLALAMVLLRPAATLQKQTASPATTASLRDEDRVISLDRRGSLEGMEGASPEERTQIAQALQSGQLTVGPVNTDLIRSRETLLGTSVAPAALRPLSPAGTTVLSDRPSFRWNAPAGAKDFRVAVYDSAFELVEAGKALNVQEWVPTRPLARGKTYTWTVSALLNGHRATAPHAPEPEARFRVATADSARLMDALARARPPSNLRLAVAASRLGLRDEANEALAGLDRENAGSPLVASLRESLKHSKK